MCPNLPQVSAGRLPTLSGEGATSVWFVSSSSLFHSGLLSVQLAVDLAGSVPSASYPISLEDFALDEVWEINSPLG